MARSYTLTGAATLADKATDDYLLLPFEAPAGIGRLIVRYTYTHRVSAALPGGSGRGEEAAGHLRSWGWLRLQPDT